jgi:Integrase core domain
MVEGMDIDRSENMSFCESCVKGKLYRNPFPKTGATRAKGLLDLIHSDVCGPISPPSIGGAKYFITFTDDMSRKASIYFLKKKSEAFEKFKEFRAKAENELERRIKRLRTDGGGEYMSKEFDKYLKDNGIVKETTVSYSPQQNGVAERLNRTILDRARTMLISSGLGKEFWAEAVSTSVYIINLSPHASVDAKTPYEAWHGTRPDVSHLRSFGCLAYSHVPDQKRTKLDAKAIKCIFLGYAEGTKGYRLWNPATRKVIISRDVVFIESETYAGAKSNSGSSLDLGDEIVWNSQQSPPLAPTDDEENENVNLDDDESDPSILPSAVVENHLPPSEEAEDKIVIEISPSTTEPQQESAPERKYPLRERRAPVRWVPDTESSRTLFAFVDPEPARSIGNIKETFCKGRPKAVGTSRPGRNQTH